MRKNIFLPILLMAMWLLVGAASCGVDIETSDNGDLDGFWHLERVDTLATQKTVDYSGKRIFWAVQAKLLNVRDVDKDGRLGYLLRFSQTSDSLILSSPYKFNWHENEQSEGGDIPVEDAEELRPYGINGLEEHYYKEALSGGKMILRSKTLRLEFRKF